MNTSFARRLAIGATTLVAAIGMAGLTAGSSSASDPDETFPGGPLLSDVHYDITGSAAVQSRNAKFTVPLGPTRITADTGFTDDTFTVLAFYAGLPLPPKTVSFKAFGYLPVRAKVSFVQVGASTGEVHLGTAPDGNDELSGSAQYVVTLSDVTVGNAKAKVGTNCQSRYPTTVSFASTKYALLNGGDLSGNFDLGKFNNCGSSNDLVNIIVPSNGNAVKLHLGSLYVGDDSPPPATTVAKVAKARKLAIAKK